MTEEITVNVPLSYARDFIASRRSIQHADGTPLFPYAADLDEEKVRRWIACQVLCNGSVWSFHPDELRECLKDSAA